MIIELNNVGTIAANQPPAPRAMKETEKAAKTFKTMWPAIMFANSRTDRVMGRTKNETISKMKIKGASQIGVPGGINKLKK